MTLVYEFPVEGMEYNLNYLNYLLNIKKCEILWKIGKKRKI